jgi:hypothetical protein
VGYLQFIWITAQTDHAEHAVTDEAQASGIAASQGLFKAVCGVVFLAAPMIAEPCNACARCLAFLRTRTLRPDIPEQKGKRRLGWLGRLWWCRRSQQERQPQLGNGCPTSEGVPA